MEDKVYKDAKGILYKVDAIGELGTPTAASVHPDAINQAGFTVA